MIYHSWSTSNQKCSPSTPIHSRQCICGAARKHLIWERCSRLSARLKLWKKNDAKWWSRSIWARRLSNRWCHVMRNSLRTIRKFLVPWSGSNQLCRKLRSSPHLRSRHKRTSFTIQRFASIWSTTWRVNGSPSLRLKRHANTDWLWGSTPVQKWWMRRGSAVCGTTSLPTTKRQTADQILH